IPGFSKLEILPARLDFQHLRKGFGPNDIEVLLGQLGVGSRGAVSVEELMSENHVASFSEGIRKLGVEIRLLLEYVKLFLQVPVCFRSKVLAKAAQHVQRLAARGGGECHVEGDHFGPVLFELADQSGVEPSR